MRIDDIKKIAERQWINGNEEGNFDDCIGFEHNGQFIVNPWIDSSGRFELTTYEAMKEYGEKKFIQFCEDISDCYEV